MKTKYQLIIIGNKSSYIDAIIETLGKRVKDLGIALDSILILNEKNFKEKFIANAPTVCLYFGDSTNDFPHLDILERIISDSNLVLPIVTHLEHYINNTPAILHQINGFELRAEINIEAIVNRILEGLSLLRLSRRLFISYRRAESTSVPKGLYQIQVCDQIGNLCHTEKVILE